MNKKVVTFVGDIVIPVDVDLIIEDNWADTRTFQELYIVSKKALDGIIDPKKGIRALHIQMRLGDD